MRIIQAFPPNYEAIKAKLGEHIKGTFYCWGDAIYNPDGIQVPLDIAYHESIHQKQQGNNVEDWWDKFLNDPDFRAAQEVEAYGEQYKFISEKVTKDRNALFTIMFKMAGILSGPQYGNIMTFGQAEAKLKRYVKS